MNDICGGYTVSGYFVQENGIIRSEDGSILCRIEEIKTLQEKCARRKEAQIKSYDDIKYLQAKIDALMIEYCPDEMTKEQIEEWEKHQRPVI